MSTSEPMPCAYCGSKYIHSDWCETIRRGISKPTAPSPLIGEGERPFVERELGELAKHRAAPSAPSNKTGEDTQQMDTLLDGIRAAAQHLKDDWPHSNYAAIHDIFTFLDAIRAARQQTQST